MSLYLDRDRLRRLLRQYDFLGPLLMGGASLLCIFTSGIFFYMHYEDWSFWDSLYMTVITLATVGFQEVHPLSLGGRIFTTTLILTGVGSFTFMVGSVAQLLVEGRLHKLLGRRRVQNKIAKLKGHYIICGYGRIGRVVANEILREGLPVVVVESSPECIKTLEEEGVLHVPGDATSDEVLTAAGISRAKSLITALTQEAANVYVVLTARQMNPDLFIISRADSETHIHRLELAGANRVVLPHTIGGLRMAQSVLRPTVISFLELAIRGGIDLQMEELLVSPTSELVNKDLIQSQIRPRFNLIVMGIKKRSGEMIFNPAPQAVIEAEDTLLAIGKKENLNQLLAIL